MKNLVDKLEPGDSLIITHQVWIREWQGTRKGLHKYLATNKGYIEVTENTLFSDPPSGAYRVNNIFVVKDPATGNMKLEVEYDNQPV